MTTNIKKNWSFGKVERALIAIIGHVKEPELFPTTVYPAYYLGGTLCIDFKYHPSVCLNRNGRGFFYKFKYNKCFEAESYATKDVKFVMTNKMQQQVLAIYQLVKGPKSVEKHDLVPFTANP